MSRRLDAIAPPLYGIVDLVVITAPAVAFKLASDRGGLGDADGIDLVVASAVLGTVHAIVAAGRLRFEEEVAIRRTDLWIAAVDALIVLALAATVLPLVVLWGFADEHASIADRGYPVVALWIGVQVVAIIAAEVTGRAVFRWLEDTPPPDPPASSGPPASSLHPCTDRPVGTARG